jgi:hypothetical protein
VPVALGLARAFEKTLGINGIVSGEFPVFAVFKPAYWNAMSGQMLAPPPCSGALWTSNFATISEREN